MRLRLLVLVLAGVLLGTGLTVAATHDRGDGGPQIASLTPVVPPTPVIEPTPDPEPTPTPEPEPEPDPEPEAQAASAAPPILDEPAGNPALERRLADLLIDPTLPSGDRLGISVIDGEGRVLLAHNDRAALLPASTQKLVSAAGALAGFGPDHRFTTDVLATAPPGGDGTIVGDLVLRGGGDPALATPRFGGIVPERPRTPLEALADQIAASGVRHVTGRLIGDPGVLPHQPLASGWPARYLDNGDATRSSGLTAEAGRRLFFDRGRLASEPAPDPAAEAAASLYVLLADRDVTVAGGPSSAPAPIDAEHHLAAVHSPPLVDLLRYSVQRSDNHVADTVFRMLGRVQGDGSWDAAAQATRAALAPLGLDWEGVVMADGSGLSRDDRLSARFLTELDARMHRSTRAAEWSSLMAVSGQSGTLRRRLVSSVAHGRLHGKTGSLRDVRSLSGSVVGPEGDRLFFAVIGNGLSDPEKAAVRALQDQLVLVLAEDLYGCVWVPVAPPALAEDGSPIGDAAGDDAAQHVEPDEVEMELQCAA